MDHISRLNSIINSLRSQIEPLSGKTARKTDKKTDKSEPEETASSALSMNQLEQRIVERIKTIDPDADNPQRKAFFILVESILAWEFGEQLLKDPEFYEIINKVTDSIQDNTSLNKTISQFLTKISK